MGSFLFKFLILLAFFALIVGCDGSGGGNDTLFFQGSNNTPVNAPPQGTGGALPNFGLVALSFSTGVDPVIVQIGDSGIGIADTTGFPNGGVFSLSNPNTTATGGIFTIDPATGVIDFTGFTSAGLATVDVNYTAGNTATETFSVIVPLSFTPPSPGVAFVGGADIPGITTAEGFPIGGTFSITSQTGGGTGATFTIDSLGTVDCNGPFTATGTASVTVQYDTLSIGIFTLTYNVTVGIFPTIVATPPSPLNVAIGEPDVTIVCVGNPPGGTFSLANESTGTTGGDFSIDILGNLTFAGPFTAAGTATVDVLYDIGTAVATLSYTVQVVRGLIITGVCDGPLTGGIPKAIEFYVQADIADLSIYGVGSANNGGGTDGQEFTFPADFATEGSYIYLATEATAFLAFFGFSPDYTNGTAPSINGDDAIELFQSGTVIDIFGTIAFTAPPTVDWFYEDGWAYRLSGTGPDGSTFVLTNWDVGNAQVFDGATTNAGSSSPMPIGTYTP